MTFSGYNDSTMRIFSLYIKRISKSAKNYPKSLLPAIIIVNMLSIQLNHLPVHTHAHIMHHMYAHIHTIHIQVCTHRYNLMWMGLFYVAIFNNGLIH